MRIIPVPPRFRAVPPSDVAHLARRDAGHDGVVGNNPGDHGARPDEGALAHADTAHDRRIAAQGGTARDERFGDFPVRFALQRAPGGHRGRIDIVDEHHAVAHENFVLDHDASADERMARNLAARANPRPLLNFDESADARLVADGAAVKIDEVGLENLHRPCPERRHWRSYGCLKRQR
jgi:hypothetical protein